MPIPRFAVWMISIAMMIRSAGMVSGQDYPNKPIRMVAPEAGGGADFSARLIARAVSGPLGQQVIVDNRGGEFIAVQIAAKAPPDGYTLLFFSSSLWTLPLMKKAPYDPVRDFSTVTLAIRQPNILVVHPSAPVNSVKELIALAKARPGELNYASSGTGTSNHLAAELFKAMASVNMVRVPYKGTGPALIGLIGGQTHLMFSSAGSATPHIKSGRLRALAVTSTQPSALAPELPTVAATGLPGYEFVGRGGIFAPARTPAAIVNRLNQEIVRVLNSADVKKKFFNGGIEAVGSSPEEFAAEINAEMARLNKVIRDAGIRAD